MTVIRAAHYDEAIAALKADPVVIGMTATIDASIDCTKSEFMLAANKVYADRGGKLPGHIGAVASAIAQLVADRQD